MTLKGKKDTLKAVAKELEDFLEIINNIIKLNNNLSNKQKHDYYKLKTLLEKFISETTDKPNSDWLGKDMQNIEDIIKIMRRR